MAKIIESIWLQGLLLWFYLYSIPWYSSNFIPVIFLYSSRMANKGKKRQFTSDMTANSSGTVMHNKGHNTICPNCKESFKLGQESIFCEGDCAQTMR